MGSNRKHSPKSRIAKPMTMKEKLYFENKHEIYCYPLSFHLDYAKEEGLEQITLYEAIQETVEGFHWCMFDKQTVEKDDCCKAMCTDYNSKSGRGVCMYRGKFSKAGNEVNFQVK